LVSEWIKPGVSLKKIDQLAYEFIKDNDAHPSFLGYRNFPNSLCMSLNEVVVHGLPTEYELKDGDIISIDCGVYKNGYHGDSAYTYTVGEIEPATKRLLQVTYESLYLGIEKAVQGMRIGDISYAIQNHVEAHGYSVVRELVGHGVGAELHQKPDVPNFGGRGKGSKLESGLVLAIEPMINMGGREVYMSEDKWSIFSNDHLPSAHYEHTVAVRKGKAEILSTFEYIQPNQRING
jgi:methionyl aminopeptidase